MSDALHGIDDFLGRLIHASWQGAVLAVVVMVICRVYPALQPRWQVWLWRLVVVKFGVAFLWTTPLELPLLTPARDASATSSAKVPTPATNEDIVTNVASQNVSLIGLSVGLVWLTGVVWRTLLGLRAALELRQLRRQCQPCHDAEWHTLITEVSCALGL